MNNATTSRTGSPQGDILRACSTKFARQFDDLRARLIQPHQAGVFWRFGANIFFSCIVFWGAFYAKAEDPVKLSKKPNVFSDNVGKQPPAGTNFMVNQFYKASGKMGDIADVIIAGNKFTYSTKGKGLHEWDYKYDDEGKMNPSPCQFGGVIWLSPANAFGTDPQGGYDLRGFRRVVFEARCIDDPVKIEFMAGGVTWIWGKDKDGKMTKIPTPYPDTLPHISSGTKTLTPEWQELEISLNGQPDDNLKRVVGGFGWIVDWGSNGVELNDAGDGPKKVKELKFEIQNIRYEK